MQMIPLNKYRGKSWNSCGRRPGNCHSP